MKTSEDELDPPPKPRAFISQYLLAPFAFALSLVLALTCVERKARWLFAAGTVTNTLAIFLMFFRGYYND